MSLIQQTAMQRYATKTYLKWGDVVEIAEEAGLPKSAARKIIAASQGTAEEPRKYLPGRSKPLYMRRVVLRLFGLLEESASA